MWVRGVFFELQASLLPCMRQLPLHLSAHPRALTINLSLALADPCLELRVLRGQLGPCLESLLGRLELVQVEAGHAADSRKRTQTHKEEKQCLNVLLEVVQGAHGPRQKTL